MESLKKVNNDLLNEIILKDSDIESLKNKNDYLKHAIEKLVDEYIKNQGSSSEFVVCITPSKTPNYWLNAMKLIGRESFYDL